MRQLLLVALISSLATSAFAQAHDLPSPSARKMDAKQSAPAIAPVTAKTELQKEAERVATFQTLIGLNKTVSDPVAAPTPLSTQSVQAPAAPDGLKPMKLYDSPAAGSVHTVVQKDTLYNISKRYGVTVVELKQANQLTGSAIQLGQNLQIPVRKQIAGVSTPNLRSVVQPVIEAKPKPEADTQLAADPGQGRIMAYAVLSGDTLAAIARRTCISSERLISQNDLSNPDELSAGHMLSLPDDHCLAQ